MRVVEITKPGPPEVLVVREKTNSEVKADHVAIDVKASGVNFADIMGRMGLYPDAPPFPFVPGYEVAGLCEEKPVFALTRFNGYADRVIVPKGNVFPLPEVLSMEEGAAIPVNYVTAWAALYDQARIREGDRVLVEHGAGGVGIAALQICKHFGAQYVGVVGSEEKAQFLRERGGEAVLRHQKLEGPFNVILDPTGATHLKDKIKLLATAGRIILYGASEFVKGRTRNMVGTAWRYLRRPKLDPYQLPETCAGIFGLNMLHYSEEATKSAMQHLIKGIQDGWLRPHVGAKFPLEKASEAHSYMQDRKNIGKVVLTVNAN